MEEIAFLAGLQRSFIKTKCQLALESFGTASPIADVSGSPIVTYKWKSGPQVKDSRYRLGTQPVTCGRVPSAVQFVSDCRLDKMISGSLSPPQGRLISRKANGTYRTVYIEICTGSPLAIGLRLGTPRSFLCLSPSPCHGCIDARCDKVYLHFI